jgi:hypothetical protein
MVGLDTSDVVKMQGKKNSASFLGDGICCITRHNIFTTNQITFCPVNESIMSYINMTRLLCGLTSMGHKQDTTIVFIKIEKIISFVLIN